ncbi:MAG: hypothetical protein PHX54_04055, partial [Lentimicrobiaceae bacterium]|nr:hypothetical protein [Lentimicrobiaceae bacterium]
MKQAGTFSMASKQGIYFALLLLLIVAPCILKAQDTTLYFPPKPINDSLQANPHSPRKATIYSLV